MRRALRRLVNALGQPALEVLTLVLCAAFLVGIVGLAVVASWVRR